MHDRPADARSSHPDEPDVPDSTGRGPLGRPGSGLVRRLEPVSSFVRHHETALWWVHSTYALLIGVVFMWLGSRNYLYLRLAVFHVAFIWVTSLIVPTLVDATGPASAWRSRARLVINYFNKNFYQQLLFFLLPIYYASATWGAANMAFVGFLAVSALVSTLDVFYDRHLSVRRSLSAVFFAFNLFACANVMLPVVWSVSNTAALEVSAWVTMAALLTVGYRASDLRRPRVLSTIALSGVLLFSLVRWGTWLIPPAPLRAIRIEIGGGFDREAMQLTNKLSALPPGWSGAVYGLSAIQAPLGLEDRVRHEWYQDGRLVYASMPYRVQGGRREGFRLWTRHVGRTPLRTRLRLDVRTEAGQLIGRTALDAR
jgi:hypothetical protein